jgi:hypothetical protein
MDSGANTFMISVNGDPKIGGLVSTEKSLITLCFNVQQTDPVPEK